MQRLRLRVFPHIRRCPLVFQIAEERKEIRFGRAPPGPISEFWGLDPVVFFLAMFPF